MVAIAGFAGSHGRKKAAPIGAKKLSDRKLRGKGRKLYFKHFTFLKECAKIREVKK